jgi:hypothetical protein
MTSTTGDRWMSRAEVVERARGIAAAVAPHVERAEQLRRMPPENVKANRRDPGAPHQVVPELVYPFAG